MMDGMSEEETNETSKRDPDVWRGDRYWTPVKYGGNKG